MSWERQSHFINLWLNELEILAYDLGVPPEVLGKTRHLLTKAVDASLAGPGRPGDYLAIGCFYLACKICGSPVTLDRLLSTSLGSQLEPSAVSKTIRNLLRRLELRVCHKCGKEARGGERFCSSCGSWLSDNVITQAELDEAEK